MKLINITRAINLKFMTINSADKSIQLTSIRNKKIISYVWFYLKPNIPNFLHVLFLKSHHMYDTNYPEINFTKFVPADKKILQKYQRTAETVWYP